MGFGDAELGDDRIARGAEPVEQDRSGGHGTEEDGEQTDARSVLVMVSHRSPPVAGMLGLSMLAGGRRRVLRRLSCAVQPFDRRTDDR